MTYVTNVGSVKSGMLLQINATRVQAMLNKMMVPNIQQGDFANSL